MQNKVKRNYFYLFLIMLVILFSVSIFFFFNRTKQEDTVKDEHTSSHIINYAQLDGYYLGFMKAADSKDTKQLVLFRINKFYPKASQTPQANLTYQTLDSQTLNDDSYHFLTNELNEKVPDKLLDHLSIFGQGPLYWTRTTEMSGEKKTAAPLIYASKKENKMSVIIDYDGSDEPELASFSLVKISKNEMNDKGVSLIKQYLLDPEKSEKSLLNYYGIIEFNKAISMVDEESMQYIGATASQILD